MRNPSIAPCNAASLKDGVVTITVPETYARRFVAADDAICEFLDAYHQDPENPDLEERWWSVNDQRAAGYEEYAALLRQALASKGSL